MMENALDSFKKVTKVVVDSSDFKSLAKFKPIDATTNPSLIIKSINSPHYQGIVNRIHKQSKIDGKSQLQTRWEYLKTISKK